MNNSQRNVQSKLTKGLLDLIVLQFLETEPMHGYQIIATIRKSFGVYLGPSTIYPLLNTLEEKGHIKSNWNMDNERPRKVYNLTNDGKAALAFTANSLTMICRGIKIEVNPIDRKVGERPEVLRVPENPKLRGSGDHHLRRQEVPDLPALRA